MCGICLDINCFARTDKDGQLGIVWHDDDDGAFSFAGYLIAESTTLDIDGVDALDCSIWAIDIEFATIDIEESSVDTEMVTVSATSSNCRNRDDCGNYDEFVFDIRFQIIVCLLGNRFI